MQEVLGSVFRQALDKANACQEQPKEHIKRLQAKRRRTEPGTEGDPPTVGGQEAGSASSQAA
eukprot:1708273-Pyramimonas_sp.AAC.1